MKWSYFTAAFLVLFAVAAAEGEIWEEDDHEVLIRSERGANDKESENCRYTKGQWSECDLTTAQKTRTLTLKKNSSSHCEQTKTVQKKCKRACRYEKGSWSDCSSDSQSVRIDKLKSNSDPSCEQNRQTTRPCKSKGGKNKSGKGMTGNYQNKSKRKNASGGRRNKQ